MKRYLTSLILLFLLSLPAHAVLDGAVCSSGDTGGTACNSTQLKANINEEDQGLDDRTPVEVFTITGTNTYAGNVSPAITAYDPEMSAWIKVANTNTGAATINFNTIGAKALVSSSGAALSAGDLRNDTIYLIKRYATNDEFRVITQLGTGAAPGSGAFVTIGNSGSLSAERALTAGTGLGLTDGGANSTATLAITDVELTSIAGLTSAANKMPYFTGSGAAALADFPATQRTYLTTPSSANLRAVLSDEVGTGLAMFGLISTMSDDLGCTGSQIVRRNAGDTAFECATGAAGLVSTDIDTSAELRTIMTDELGTGVLFFLGAPAADDQVFVSTSISAGAWGSIPDSDLATQKLQYDVTTNAFSAGTDDDVPEAGADFVNLALSGDVTSSGLVTTVAANAVALTTDTTGNYMADIAAGAGIATTHTPAEGSTGTIAFDFSDAGASPALALDSARFTSNATVPGMLVFEGDTADAFESRVVITDPTADRAFTIPNADSVAVQPFACTGTDKYSTVSSLGVVTCTADDDVPEAGADFVNIALTGDVTSVGLATTVAVNAVALTTDTTGNYAAGDAEAGNALTGDTATAFFSAGTIEDARIDGSLEADEVNPTLGTQTQGNYQTGNTAGAGIAITQTPAEGFSATVALDYSDQGADPALAADACQFTSNATTSGFIVCEGDTANTFETRIFVTDPTADRLVTIPNADSATVQPLTCGGTDKVSAVSALGVVTCSADAGAGGGIGNIVEDLTPQLGGTLDTNGFAIEFGTAAVDTSVVRSTAGHISVEGKVVYMAGDTDVAVADGGTGASSLTDLIALTTQTTGNYAAGDAEAGNALTGDSATAFFTLGALEVARGGHGAAPAADDQVFVSSSISAGAWATLPDSESAGTIIGYDVTTNAWSTKTDDDVPEAGDFGALALTGDVTTSGLAATVTANAVALTTDTTGNYALGDAEGGAATTGDSATAFFSAGSLEDARMTLKTESFCVAASDETTAITTGTAKITFRMPYAFTLTNIRGSLNTVSSSGSPIIDVNEAGTTVMTTNKVLIDVSELTSVTAVTAVTLTDTALADDASMTIDVDTAGTGAKGLKVCLIGHQ